MRLRWSVPRLPAALLPVLVAVIIAWGIVSIHHRIQSSNYRELVQTEVQRDADLLTRVAISAPSMGAVSALGLVNPTIKAVLKDQLPAEDALLLEELQSVQDAFAATAVYIVRSDGLVPASVVSIGASFNGDQVAFRPYFQRAMQGENNFYVAISTTTGLRSMYVAAPVFDTPSTKSPVIGAVVMRLSEDALLRVMNRPHTNPTFLLSPQNIIFSSNLQEWFGYMAKKPTASELEAIRQLKQFGKSFQENTIQILPFDLSRASVLFDGREFQVHSAKVDWNDPNGEWKLITLAHHNRPIPWHYQWALGLGSGLVVLALGLFILRLRLQFANAKVKRFKAEEELKAHSHRLEAESEMKSFLNDLSITLQQTNSYSEFGQQLLSHITPRMAASYAAVYAFQAQTNGFVPMAGFGAPVESIAPFALDQGLLGQVAHNGQTLLIDDPKQLPIKIQSGLGSDVPQSVLLIPIHHLQQKLGLMVIAGLRPFNATQLALQEELKPMVAIQLSVMQKTLSIPPQHTQLTATM
jgi:C4-dicarboxylate-specific signal transduction histidine kinase